MLFVRDKLKALCTPCGSGYYRYPTEEHLVVLGDTDVLEGDMAPGCIVYRDLNNLRQNNAITGLCRRAWGVVVLIALLLIAVALRTVTYALQIVMLGQSGWKVGIGVGVALLITYLLYHAIVQATNPVIIDGAGVRIALKDGRNTMFSKDVVEFAHGASETVKEDS